MSKGKYLKPSFLDQSDAYACLLAVDTATQACSVAISKDNNLVVETTTVTGQTHSRHLLSMIQSALSVADVQFAGLDGFVVTKGPGSFTGLRIGISTIKGLARALNKKIIGVSYLECLARQSAVTNGLVCAIIDARRQEFYYALYQFAGTGLKTIVPETVGPISELIRQIDGKCHFIGNGVYPNRQKLQKKLGKLAEFAPDFQNTLRAYTLLEHGRKLLLSGCQNHLEHFTPSYIRKSDAQVNMEERSMQNATFPAK